MENSKGGVIMFTEEMGGLIFMACLFIFTSFLAYKSVSNILKGGADREE